MHQSDAYRNLAKQRSFYKTKILLHHCALPYSVRFRKSSQTNCPNWEANSPTSGTILGLCPRADPKLNPCVWGIACLAYFQTDLLPCLYNVHNANFCKISLILET